MKYCETLKAGFYLIKDEKCFYITGTTKGNKWVDLDTHTPEWWGLMWNCIDPDEIEVAEYHETNPLEINP